MSREHWNARFADAGDAYVFGEAPSGFLTARADLLEPGMRVLSVADGEGRNSVWMARQGLQVEALEFAPAAVAKARRLAAANGVSVSFHEADVFDWAWPPETYDAVVAVFIQFVAPASRARLFELMQRTVKPGGLLMLHGYTPKQLEYRTGGPSAVENLYTEEMLRQAFAGLEILALESYEKEIEEGLGHRGMSALVDLVGRKPAA